MKNNILRELEFLKEMIFLGTATPEETAIWEEIKEILPLYNEEF